MSPCQVASDLHSLRSPDRSRLLIGHQTRLSCQIAHCHDADHTDGCLFVFPELLANTEGVTAQQQEDKN